MTRGVLYDTPRLRGTDQVRPGQPVHGWELAEAAAAQGVTPASGDTEQIRCGADAGFEALARACAELGRRTFQFMTAPLALEGGTGSPVDSLVVL